jgi:hypothetical protein
MKKKNTNIIQLNITLVWTDKNKIKHHVEVHGEYSRIGNYWTKISGIFHEMFGNFFRHLEIMYLFSVSWQYPSWEMLFYMVIASTFYEIFITIG